MYGFWFKNKLRRRVAKRLGLNWKRDAGKIFFRLSDEVGKSSGVWCGITPVVYRGQPATIFSFVEDDNRKLDKLEYTEKQIDAVRKAMCLPSGTKPKWYEICDKAYDPDAGPDSDDEPFPERLKRGTTCGASRSKLPEYCVEKRMEDMTI